MSKLHRGRVHMLPCWVTSDGLVIPLSEMEQEHLDDTVALLRRAGLRTRLEIGPMPATGLNGEDAQWLADRSFDVEMEDWLRQKIKVSSSLERLMEEAKRRKRAA